MFTRTIQRVLRQAPRRFYCEDAAEPPKPRQASVPVFTGERGVNKVTLVGRVGRKPEVRGNEDNPVTMFPLATSQSFKTPDGVYKQKTEWHKVVIFRRALGAMIADTIDKGDKLYIGGSILYSQMRSQAGDYEIKVTSIRADDIIKLADGKKKTDEEQPPEWKQSSG